MIHPAWRRFFMTSVRFYAGNGKIPAHAFDGLTLPLTKDNIFQCLLASGAVPLALNGVKHIEGAPPGVYFDGGLERYVFNESNDIDSADITLLIYHGGPIISTWFDRRVLNPEKRTPVLDKVAIVRPSEAFIRSLPYGKVPDRADWKKFEKDPARRIAVWRRGIEQSRILGERFMEMVQGGAIKRLIAPLETR